MNARRAAAAFLLGCAATSHPGHVSAQDHLPLVEVPAAGVDSMTLALLISGDGNWAAADRKMSAALAARGIAVVGLEARTYLTHRHPDPDIAARDVEGVLRAYLDRWHRSDIVLVGYSRGADMIPFVANRLPGDLRERIHKIVLIGPVENASFQFHYIDLVKNVHRPTDLPLLPEVERLDWADVLCIYGEDEHDTLCRAAPPGLMETDEHAGGHRIHDPEELASTVVDWLTRRAR